MELNYFKDKLFDVLNESDELELSDITVDDRHDLLTVSTADGSVFELQCRKKRSAKPPSAAGVLTP